MSGNIYLLISRNTVTFVAGLYASYDDATKGFIDILLKDEKLYLLEELFGHFDMDFPNDHAHLHSLFFSDLVENEFIKELLVDYVPFSIDCVKVNKIFDFTQYQNWDQANLYDTLRMVRKGKTGCLGTSLILC